MNEREQFEAWANAKFGAWQNSATPQTERFASYWECWQAALAASPAPAQQARDAFVSRSFEVGIPQAVAELTAAPAPSVEAQADAIRRALESASDDLSERLSNIGGCTDGGCQVVPPKGMHTNGGCKCLSDHRTARRVVHAYQVFAKSVAALKEPQR